MENFFDWRQPTLLAMLRLKGQNVTASAIAKKKYD